MVWESTSADLVHVLSRAALSFNREDLQAIDEVCKRVKPVDYDAHQTVIRRNYEDNQVPRLKEVLAGKYPLTHKAMSPTTINITKATAEMDAQAYRKPPRRWLEVDGQRPGDVQVVGDEEVEVLPGQAWRSELLAEQIKRARLHMVMPEMERRCMASKTQFGRVVWQPFGKSVGRKPRLKVDTFWPCDVDVIPNQQFPGALWAADLIKVRISGDPGDPDGAEWFEIWRRQNVTDDGALFVVNGEVLELGPIFVEQVSSKGESRGVQPYGSRIMPWFRLTDGLCDDAIFQDTGRDLVAMQDAVNSEVTDWWFKSAMSGHGMIYTTGAMPKPGTTSALGPNVRLDLPAGATMGAIAPQLSDMALKGLERMLSFFGHSRRQPADAWRSDQVSQLSGYSRVVMNLPAFEKREERIDVYTTMEEEDLIPILVDVHDLHNPRKIGGPGITYHVDFPPPPDYMDPAQKQLMAEKAQKMGWLSPAEAAVFGGARRTLDEAIAAGLSTIARPEVEHSSTAQAAPEGVGGPQGELDPAGRPQEGDDDGPEA